MTGRQAHWMPSIASKFVHKATCDSTVCGLAEVAAMKRRIVMVIVLEDRRGNSAWFKDWGKQSTPDMERGRNVHDANPEDDGQQDFSVEARLQTPQGGHGYANDNQVDGCVDYALR